MNREWIDIKDGVPELGRLVIAWRENGYTICKYKESIDNWKFKKERGFINVMSNYPFACKDVTHWMYFPEPPINK